ncbi:M1 family metallopeptidase [Granulicella paludicola]|uniref:M1 family metallopeptidase n=1 Tax=Granulicella paludicola TaxID=474951 RepID=UPI0021DFD908|nr:M1 family aminopeptidase [Granulicella paludicola]
MIPLRLSTLATACTLLLSSSFAGAQSPGPGVSKDLAVSRAARISNLHYALSFQLAPHASVIPGTETIDFTNTGTGDLALDYRDGSISQASLNGTAIPTALTDGHLNLPASALASGKNELKLTFISQVATSGKAFTRYEDRDDHNEYLYTLFVPMDASMAFPCFDQPDLKGRFALQITAPSEWTIIANTAADRKTRDGATAISIFPDTRPISTYLFAFAAGPFEALAGVTAAEPTLYVRKSQLARAKAEAPQVQKMAASGIRYFSDYFAQPFPFPKYDLVLIPGFPFGGMEHAGASFLNEDGVLFRTAPTASDYFRRNILVLHETCHQWFGDLVTMRWFDDLWLKEGFAQYMAYKALAQLEPAQNPWKHFYEDIKPAAYAIDETQGTTPIFQNIANLKDAKSAYGAIVYQKAPSVLKQLNFFLGEDSFRDGLRLYLKQHAYANAQWADLVHAFSTAAQNNQQQRDVDSWAKAWILQRGMPEVTIHFECAAGKITKLTLHQQDVLPDSFLWPISNDVLLSSSYGAEVLHVRWNTAVYPVAEAVGKTCPTLAFANEGDFGYGRFLLDAPSAASATQALDTTHPQLSASVADPLLRSMLWGALWDNVHVAATSPTTYIDLVLKALPHETDESLSRIEGVHLTTALHAYLSDATRAAYLPRVEDVLSDRMLHASTLGLRIVSYRSFTGIAETPHALAQVKSLLNGTLSIADMPLKPLDRWNLIGHLIAMNDPAASDLFSTEKAKDHSGEGQKYAYAVEAATPSAATKQRYFTEYLHSTDRPEDWITQSLGSFNSWNQTTLTGPYLTQALNALPEIKQHRKIFFLGAWLGSFIDGQHSPEAQTAVHQWLSVNTIDPDLRLKVLEVSDALDRTVMIRQRFAH